MKSIPVQCTRCRHRHLDSQRVKKSTPNRRGFAWSDLVCPRCGCKSYYDLRPQQAWCWASGLIEIGDAMPADNPDGSGAILIASGPKAFLKTRLEVLARHGQGESAGRLLVPGVPEAEGQMAKADAVAAWLDWCAERRARDGVKFARERHAA